MAARLAAIIITGNPILCGVLLAIVVIALYREH